ncbi:unnamed protein product [Clavelina lepadiformis]|uniref:Failed axon connections-like protein n=1 Tax=Clavelina lepadiformis TaxID=159417 RepID=A0ABP0GAE9_CLALP
MSSKTEAQSSGNVVKDEITVFGFGKSFLGPCLSPFNLKLQTYLRMTDIKYKPWFTTKMSSKGKIPYIEHNGKIVEDSSFIIQHLNSEYKKDLNAHLTPAEKAIALSFQRLVEENLYWTLAYQRWLMDDSILDLIPFPNRFATKLFSWYTSLKLRPELRKNMRGQGIGRHSEEEILKIAKLDLGAIADFLGEKEFFMGSQPSEVDAVIFGFVGLMIFTGSNSVSAKDVTENHPNLVAYVERMKQMYWPDWDKLCIPEGTTSWDEMQQQCG